MLLTTFSNLELFVLVLVILIVTALVMVAVAFIIFMLRRSRSRSANPAPLPATVELTPREITVQLAELKKQIDTETKGFTGWVKWLSLILAFLLAVLAVPKAWTDLSESAFAQPDTKVIPESYLSMTRDPQTQSIQFVFAFTIFNNGKKRDSINSVSARLIRIDDASPTPLLELSDTSFQFLEKNAKIPNHFSITESSPREITCYVGSYLSDATKASFLIPQSRWRLAVELMGDGERKHSIDYCFDMSESDITDIFASDEATVARLLNPSCEGE